MIRSTLFCVALCIPALAGSVSAEDAEFKVLAKNAQAFCGFFSGDMNEKQKACIDEQLNALTAVIEAKKAGVSQETMDLCLATSMEEKKDNNGASKYVFDLRKVESCVKS